MIVAVKNIKRDKGRDIPRGSKGSVLPGLLFFIKQKVLAFLPVSAILFLTITSCKSSLPDEVQCEVAMNMAASSKDVTLDLFFYNNDEECRLDAYQRFTGLSGTVHGASRTGMKKVIGITNLSESAYTWSDINSLHSLSNLKTYLDEDSPDAPIMSGMTSIDAGRDLKCRLKLTPVMSEVILRSIRCDFKGRSYDGEEIEDVKVYLTNVCNAWPVLKDSLSHSSDYINIGRADSSSMAGLRHPEYIYKELDGNIGAVQSRTDLHFYCYPNTNDEESLGSPYTRLVIEGYIMGKKYYYPLNVNRRDGGYGIERNRSYELDVILTRLGSLDPDTAVDSSSAAVTVSVTEWNDKGKQYVSY